MGLSSRESPCSPLKLSCAVAFDRQAQSTPRAPIFPHR